MRIAFVGLDFDRLAKLSFGFGLSIRLHQEFSIFGMGQCGIIVKRYCAFVSFFRLRWFVGDEIKLCQAQIGPYSLGIDLDGPVQLGKGLLALTLREQHATIEDMTLNMVRILLQDLFDQSLGFALGFS